MWVRSQDKKILGNYEVFTIANGVGSKKNYIYGTGKYRGFFESSADQLGVYDSFEQASEELTRLQDALEQNSNKVHEMK